MSLFKEYSYKRGAALSVGSTFVWKILSFINSILIAFYFGTQTKSDIYFYIIYLASLIATFFRSLNSNVFIPQAIHLKRESEAEAKTFLNSFLLLYLSLLTLILLITTIFPVNIFQLISKFSINVLSQDTLILLLAFLYFYTYIIFYFILDIMYVYHIFSINFLFPLNALLPMLCLILFHNSLGLKTMLLGFIIAYFIQIITCLVIMKKKLNWSFSKFKIILEKRLKDNIITNQILIIIRFFVSMVPVYLISNFAGGIISALSYAKQLTDSPTEIITAKITEIYNIKLNENASAKDFDSLNTNYIKVNFLLLFIMIPLAVFTCYFAPDIVNLFFKRGKFNTESTLNVVKFLRPLMLYLIFVVLAPFSGSIIASTRKIKESFKYILFRDIIIIGVMYFAISHFGPFAYPYAFIFYSLFSYLIYAYFFKKHLPQINFWQPLKDAILLVGLNLLALIPAVFMGYLLKEQIEFIKIFFSGIVFLAVLALLYIPTGVFKKILPSVLGAHYEMFLNKIPAKLQRFFI